MSPLLTTGTGIYPAPTGGAFPCVGTAGFHSPSPNDIRKAGEGGGPDWDYSPQQTATFGVADPLSGATASSFRELVGGASFDSILGSVAAFTLNSGTTYTFGAYIKAIAGPTWVLFQTSDGIANAFGSWFNISGSGAVGSVSAAGTASLTCAQVLASTNGYVRISIGGNVSVTNTGMKIDLIMVDGNGTGVSTLNQQMDLWQVCP